MSSFKKYFSYHFKTTLVRLLIMLGIALLLTFTFTSIMVHEERMYDYSTNPRTEFAGMYAGGSIDLIGWIAAICAMVLPVLELLPFKNKRNMDTLLSLPVGRGRLVFAHYLNGLIHMAVVLFGSFSLVAIKMIPYAYVFEIWMLIPFYLMLLLVSAILYSFFAFIFSVANTIADGIVWMHIYPILPVLSVQALYQIPDKYPSSAPSPILFTPFYHFYQVTYKYCRYVVPAIRFDKEEGLDKIYSISCTEISFENEEIITLVLWALIAVACVVGLVLCFKRQRIEDLGGISSSPFGYMSLIPIMSATLVLLSLHTALLVIFTFVWYIVYRRGFRFKIPDIIVMGTTLVASIVENIIRAL